MKPITFERTILCAVTVAMIVGAFTVLYGSAYLVACFQYTVTGEIPEWAQRMEIVDANEKLVKEMKDNEIHGK